MSFYADCACLSSSRPSRQPLSQVKPAVTSAEARPVAWLVRQCQQGFSPFVPLIRPSWNPRALVTVPAITSPSVPQHLLIKLSKRRTLGVLRKAWSEAISSTPNPPLPSPVRHGQAAHQEPQQRVGL
uniref:Uncharacterized protein n=1 Tax=Molossus molossus TaxID=27622 RepID=A0A7J8HHI9_MOLMO|nr:hypothetical protein HJG59_010974 [Molossus molossus]